MAHMTVDGVRIGYQVHGEGPPVLLLCGTGMVKETWLLAWVPALVAAGRQVVIMDSRGIGESDAPEPPYSYEQMAGDVAGVIEGLGIGPCLVAGYSQGGGIAERLLTDRPDLVRAAALVASAFPVSAYGRIFTQAQVEAAVAGVEVPKAVSVTAFLGLLLTPAQLQDDTLVQAMYSGLIAGPAWTGPGRVGQFTANLDADLDGSHRPCQASISRPVLVVAFEQDVIIRPHEARDLAAAVPGAEFVLIEGAGHGGLLTHADPTSKAVIDFFSRQR